MTNENEIIIFETEDKSISLPVRIENESVWLNRNQKAELYERDVKTIGKHINNAFKRRIILKKCLRHFNPLAPIHGGIRGFFLCRFPA